MKIDLTSIDKTQFTVNKHVIGGEDVYLVIPQVIGTKWTQQNKIFRSSLWDSNGNLISASLPKFTNYGENPDNFPTPTSISNSNVITKIDGSLLIVSKWKGNYILRTRGTVDATKLKNGYELTEFKNTILPKIDILFGKDDTWDKSILFEWVSPNNKIILNYGDKPDWYLVGGINHYDYYLFTQNELNSIANRFGFKRPEQHTFASITDLIDNVKSWKSKEGVVLYTSGDQVLHKCKSLWYLSLHRMKEALSSFDKVVEVWFAQGKPEYDGFKDFIVNQFDYELWSQIQDEAKKICNCGKIMNDYTTEIINFVNNDIKPLSNRKDQAGLILNKYNKSAKSGICFKLLNNKPMTIKDETNIFYECLGDINKGGGTTPLCG